MGKARPASAPPPLRELRQGSCFPPFLGPRKTAEKAQAAVIQAAWVGGMPTRRMDDLVQAMGLSGSGKNTVSKLCKDIDDRVHAFLAGRLAVAWAGCHLPQAA